VSRELEVNLDDTSVGGRLTLSFEGRVSAQELEAKNSERPEIDSVCEE